MCDSSILEKLHCFIALELLEGDGHDLSPTTNLLALGVIDSLSMMSLQTFIESTFGVHLTMARSSPDDFTSLDAMVRMIERIRAEETL